MTSSDDMTWATPQKWFDYLNLEFGFTLDPCCLPETAKCKKFYTPKDDGLAQSWQDERVFMNPPYGREIGKWMKKALVRLHGKSLPLADGLRRQPIRDHRARVFSKVVVPAIE
jgi:phage N-6-adenine-methyltransferase